MRTEQTSVLVVGGGLVGLSAAMFLPWCGVPTMLVERHQGSSPHPRAIGYTPRTSELYRSVGLEPLLPPIHGRLGKGVRRIRVKSLAGEWFEEMHWAQPPRADEPPAPEIEYSPCGGIALAQDRLEPILRQKATELGADVRFSTELLSFAQDRLEPILRQKATELGADVRFSTELLSFTQDGDGVYAEIRGADGETYAVRAAYLVAADGHRSPVREALRIGRGGRGHLHTGRSVLFRAPLERYLESGFGQFVIDQPGLGMLTTYGDGRWVLFFDDIEYDEEGLRDLILRATGLPDLTVELITTGRWEVSASIAERYGDGRVFLAGDAAHALPPNRGGYSANTGIEDAHNLAWKLAAVLAGESAPALLETYEAERRPIAWLCHDQIFAHNDGQDPSRPGDTAEIIDDQAMAFGYLYRSGAVLGASGDLPSARRPEEWAGQPGTRAPHVRLADDRSTLDLYGNGWLLLAGGDWTKAAYEAAEKTGIPLECRLIETAPLAGQADQIRGAYGLTETGASLIRPDGYIAWRAVSLPADPVGALARALATVAHPSGYCPVP